MTGGPSAIRTGKVKKSIKGNGLQRQGNQGVGGPEGIEIHEIKTLGAQQAIRQQPTGRKSCPSQETAVLQYGKIGSQEGESLGIGIIGPKTANPRLQPVAQASQAAPGHQIQNPWRPPPAHGAGQKNPEVPRGSGSGIKEADTRLKRGRPFEVKGTAVIHHNMIR
jgi:hypothetical protein